MKIARENDALKLQIDARTKEKETIQGQYDKILDQMKNNQNEMEQKEQDFFMSQ